MKKGNLFFILIISLCFLMTGCFSEKDTPFYDSEWLMSNIDSSNQQYYHQLKLMPGHKVSLQTSYFDSTNVIVWSGTYKINKEKIVFNFDLCTRFEDGKQVGNYTSNKLIKYYAGEYLYSIGLIKDDDEVERYHLMLIRPKTPFYDDSMDIYGNHLEDFIKMK